jgi:lipopolysaccharide transport system permease protein
MNEKYHIHIEAKTGLFSVNFKELWKYRDLILLFTKRDFALRYKQTILGPIWIVLNPFITSVIFTIVFGQIAGISTNGVPQVLFYMGSNTIWSFFASCLTRTAGTFTSNAGIFGKVYFPRLTTPISTILSAAVDFFIQLCMFGFFWVYFLYRGEISPDWRGFILRPLILLQLGCLGLGFGIIVSSLRPSTEIWPCWSVLAYPSGCMRPRWSIP